MRQYRQLCGVSLALDRVGERWTLLIVRDLLLGPRRYTDLLDGLPGITTNLLARRLKHLVELDLVVQRSLPPPSGSTVYELTDAGRTLEPVVLALGAFGAQYIPGAGPDCARDPRWPMVSMMRRYRGLEEPLVVGWTVGDRDYRLEGGDRMTVTDGSPEAADLRIRTPERAFFALVSGKARARELRNAGALEVEGRIADLNRLLSSLGMKP
ncbi:MAG: winged helix-turn-helix transcriptional regulator [Planctomycetota bacterium]